VKNTYFELRITTDPIMEADVIESNERLPIVAGDRIDSSERDRDANEGQQIRILRVLALKGGNAWVVHLIAGATQDLEQSYSCARSSYI